MDIGLIENGSRVSYFVNEVERSIGLGLLNWDYTSSLPDLFGDMVYSLLVESS